MSPQSNNRYRNADYYYQQVNSVVKEGITLEQKKEILRVLDRAITIPSKKIISIEIGFWLLRRFYLVFYLGLDERQRLRFSSQSDIKRRSKQCLSLLIRLVLIGSTIYFVLSIIYFLKVIAGFDLVPTQHFSNFF